MPRGLRPGRGHGQPDQRPDPGDDGAPGKYCFLCRHYRAVARAGRSTSKVSPRRRGGENVKVQEQNAPPALEADTLKRVWSYLRPEMRVFIVAIIAMAAVAGAEGIMPKVVNDLLDN